MQGIQTVWNTNANPAASHQTMRTATSDASGSTQTSTSNSNISANDFLTLLVTEMKNQDPTANNDPNQYINQLVQVNSLEQLIDINQNLTSAIGGTSTASASRPASGNVVSASSTPADAGPHSASISAARSGAHRLPTIQGNLSAPAVAQGAHRVATALSGRS